MSDDVVESPEDVDGPMSARSKLIAAAIVVVMVMIGALVLVHVSSPAIAPGQAAPPTHFSSACGLCHPVSASVRRTTP